VGARVRLDGGGQLVVLSVTRDRLQLLQHCVAACCAGPCASGDSWQRSSSRWCLLLRELHLTTLEKIVARESLVVSPQSVIANTRHRVTPSEFADEAR
jgi:hypothetical protein